MHMFLMYQQLGDTKPFFKLTVVISFMADSQMVTFLSIYSSNIYICKVAKLLVLVNELPGKVNFLK